MEADLNVQIFLVLCQFGYFLSWWQGIRTEGLLMNQYFHLLGYITQVVGYVIFLSVPVTTVNWKLLITINSIWGFCFIIYFMLMLVYGCGGLDRFEDNGQYKIGATEFWSKKTCCKVLVYYPIDYEEYIDKIRARPFKYNRFTQPENFIKSMQGA